MARTEAESSKESISGAPPFPWRERWATLKTFSPNKAAPPPAEHLLWTNCAIPKRMDEACPLRLAGRKALARWPATARAEAGPLRGANRKYNF